MSKKSRKLKGVNMANENDSLVGAAGEDSIESAQTQDTLQGADSVPGGDVVASPEVTPSPTEAPVVTPAPTEPPVATPTPTVSPEASVGTVSSTAQVIVPIVPASAGEMAGPGNLDAVIASIKNNGSHHAKALISNIEHYMENMAVRKPVDPIKGAQHQANLWNTIKGLLESNTNDFPQLYSTLLALFDKYAEGVFGHRYVFRFTENIPLAKADRDAHISIVSLMMNTANVKGRALALKQIDLNKALSKGLSEAARNRVLRFYQQ